ncbi:MAG TPA: FlgD immunoglobulin-like domain containing protein, partial [Candidatus Limnocylindria bacterium]|nr:FlgD immunoglobulin-like domain containing protein [Candidatus Limnocylindria bacterium]
STVTSRYQGNIHTAGARFVTAAKIVMVDGFDPEALGARFGGPGSGGQAAGGRTDYYIKALSNIFGALCPAWTPSPVGVGDSPIAGPGSNFVNFLGLRSSNPVRSGQAVIAFGLVKTEPVEVKVYDVGGRLVKTLANRVFKAGEEHRLVWDGTSDAGQTVARGVYFYQLRTPTFASEKKLTVLRD